MSAIALRHAFAYPFRVFFLSLAVWAVLAVPAWVALISGAWQPGLGLPLLVWHQHELIYGFGAAAIAGFLLTAVCNWTGSERLHGLPLLALWLLWLAGRLLASFGGELPQVLVLTVQLAFLPLVMLDAGRRIWQARQARHLPLLLVLLLLWLLQFGLLLDPAGPWAAAALLQLMLLMLIIGGRITPSFSANWLRAQGRAEQASRIAHDARIEALLLPAMLLTLLALLSGWAWLLLPAALIAAALATLRLLLWRGWLVREEPLLWILHLSLAWIPLSLLLLAAQAAGWLGGNVWAHAAGIGAMAGLILGVITRVALGHTGRPLRLPAGIVWAYLAIQAAAALRLATALGAMPWRLGLVLSAAGWTLAFLLFLWRYTPILLAPRADGKAG